MTDSRYNPIKLRGPGPSASEIILRDRDYIPGRNQPDEAAQEPQQEKSSDEEKNFREKPQQIRVNPPNRLTP